MIFLHRDLAFSGGSNRNYGGKTEIISDCHVNSVLKTVPVSHTKLGQIVTCKPKNIV